MFGDLLYKFTKIGARVRVNADERSGRFIIDIRHDRTGEYFDLTLDPRVVLPCVVDARTDMRHLLLMSRNHESEQANKFLCGFDERHWFVAAVPDGSASTVVTAMEALKPFVVRNAEARRRIRARHRLRRRNAAFIRQGEWFFLPAPDARIDPKLVLRNEPLRRGGGKAHMVEELVRSGGETVYVSRYAPNGITTAAYAQLHPRLHQQFRWQVMRRNAMVLVRGRVRHPDHATLRLHCWHEVALNRESEASGMLNMAFLD